MIGALLDRAAARAAASAVFGEMVALLANDGNHVGAVELEGLWNKLQQQRAFALYCAYPMDQFQGVRLAGALARSASPRARHPARELQRARGTEDRLREVLTLQQKARSLEAELEERKLMEDRLPSRWPPNRRRASQPRPRCTCATNSSRSPRMS